MSRDLGPEGSSGGGGAILGGGGIGGGSNKDFSSSSSTTGSRVDCRCFLGDGLGLKSGISSSSMSEFCLFADSSGEKGTFCSASSGVASFLGLRCLLMVFLPKGLPDLFVVGLNSSSFASESAVTNSSSAPSIFRLDARDPLPDTGLCISSFCSSNLTFCRPSSEGRDRFFAGWVSDSSSACDSATSGNERFPRVDVRDFDAEVEPERVGARFALDGGFCEVSASSAITSVVWPRFRFAGSVSCCDGSTDALVERDDLLGGIAVIALQSRRVSHAHVTRQPDAFVGCSLKDVHLGKYTHYFNRLPFS